MERSTCESGQQWLLEGMGDQMRARILGPLQVCRGNEILGGGQLGGPKSRQILEILLVHLGAPVSKYTLIDLLWNGAPPAAAVSTLESHISVLRRSLQPGQGKTGVLKTTNGGYLLDREMIELDLECFQSLLHLAEHSSTQLAHRYATQALAMAAEPLLGSELLPEWAEAERRIHEGRMIAARVLAATTALALGMGAEAVCHAQLVLNVDVLNEPAWTILILGLEQDGKPLQGLQAFDHCRRIMDQELGCRPGRALQGAQQRMLHQTSATNDDFGRVIQALLTIQQTLTVQEQLTRPQDMRATGEQGFSLQEAGCIISGYLQRALSAVKV